MLKLLYALMFTSQKSIEKLDLRQKCYKQTPYKFLGNIFLIINIERILSAIYSMKMGKK